MQRISRNLVAITATLAILSTLIAGAALAQDGDGLTPPAIPGEAVYIPFPLAITLDGDLSDWEGVPTVTVDSGPLVSVDPAENGSFTFAVAADAENLYITMRMPDRTIIAGQHENEFWQEDSFEFYVNASADLNATGYNDAIFQININAADIGNTDPHALTITGVNSADRGVYGFVFTTADGWGFEAALPLTGLVTPSHGTEIGFQAHANGASDPGGRSVKLIWSKYDIGDSSWENPNVFGRGVFFEIGQTEIPEPSERILPPTPTPVVILPQVSVNQTGYLPDTPKRAAFSYNRFPGDTPLNWQLRDASGTTVLSGQTIVVGHDSASGNNVHHIDFSAYTTPGSGYTLEVEGYESVPFDISTEIYSTLKYDALAYFYHNRSGIPIEAAYAGGEQWARPAGHLSDDHVTCYVGRDITGREWGGCDYWLDVSGGWYDAGDHGKYVVNGGISVWTLMNMFERNPETFGDGSLSIPENQNGVPDILDEARWEMEFLLAMQVPAGQPQAGMVHHKMHDANWTPVPYLPPTSVDNTDPSTGRFLFPPSTAATLNLAATAAQCARIWAEIDPDFSAQCLSAAETAWEAAVANPDIPAVSFDAGGGGYGDDDLEDDFYWAAAELYITTGEDVYKDYLLASSCFATSQNLYWGNTAALGTISLALVPNGLQADEVEACRASIISAADAFVQTMNQEGYLVPMTEYAWGSNSTVLNNIVFMGLAYDFTEDPAYVNGARESMDYLMGRNPLSKSYISGYGENPLQHPHHRFWANRPSSGFPPPPPGVVAGGPNSDPNDATAIAAGLPGQPAAKCYIDDIGSYTTNEVTINWNAPLAWAAAFLDETQTVGQPAATQTTATATATATATSPAIDTATGEEAPRSLAWFWIILIAGFAGAAGLLARLRYRRRA